MAASGFTPISLYYSTTASAVPSSGNLVAGELALNTVDEKLYFKNSAGTVKLLASNATSAPVLSFSAGTTGFTPSTATTGAVTLAGTLATTNGGTGLTSFTANGVVYASSSSALATGSALTFDGTNLGVGTTSPDTLGRLTTEGSANSLNVSRTSGATSRAGWISQNTAETIRLFSEVYGASATDTGFGLTLAGYGVIRALGTASNGLIIGTATNDPLIFGQNNTEVGRFTSTGLGIGTTSFSSRLTVVGADGNNIMYQGASGGTIIMGIAGDNSAANFGTTTNHPIAFYANNSLRMTLTAAGGLVVGTSTDPGNGIIADINGNVRKVPQSGSSKTSSYTLATTDIGEYILLGASGAIVIPDATFAAGDVVSIFNNTGSTATITCSITTAYIAGTFTDKATMTLAAAGVATVLFITSTLCVVSGNVT
jgi:hypothetical protein